MREVLALIALACLVRYNIKRSGSWAYPPVLFSLVWLLVFATNRFLVWFEPYPVWTLHFDLVWLFTLGAVSFSAGGWLADQRTLLRSRPGAAPASDPAVPTWLANLFLGLTVAAVPMFLTRASELIMEAPWFFSEPYRALRWMVSYGDRGYGALNYLFPIAVTSVLCELWQARASGWNRLGAARFVLAATSAMSVALLLTGRTYPLLVILLCIGWVLPVSPRAWYVLAGGGVVFAVFFAAIGLGLNKFGLFDSSGGKGPGGLLGGFTWYVVCGSHALGQAIVHGFSDHQAFGFLTRFADALFFKLGLSGDAPVSLVLPELHAPYVVNVYTMYYTYLADDGFTFALVMPGLWGFLHTTWFHGARRGSIIARFLYALMLYPLCMSLFQEQYVTLASTWLQLFMLFGLLLLFSRSSAGKTGSGA